MKTLSRYKLVLPTDAEITHAKNLAKAGALRIAESERRGYPSSGLPVVSLTADEIAAAGGAPCEPMHLLVTLTGKRFNPRPHRTDRSTERRTYNVLAADGAVFVGVYRVIKGPITAKKSAASRANILRANALRRHGN